MELKMSLYQKPKLELKLGLQCPKCLQANFYRSEDGELICPECQYSLENPRNTKKKKTPE